MLVQVVAWCHHAPSHYPSQCWPISMSWLCHSELRTRYSPFPYNSFLYMHKNSKYLPSGLTWYILSDLTKITVTLCYHLGPNKLISTVPSGLLFCNLLWPGEMGTNVLSICICYDTFENKCHSSLFTTMNVLLPLFNVDFSIAFSLFTIMNVLLTEFNVDSSIVLWSGGPLHGVINTFQVPKPMTCYQDTLKS